MQQTNEKLITPAEYARLRGLNRSTIGRQIAEGKIPTADGKIDPVAADRARDRNIDQGRREQAARQKARRAKKPIPLAVQPIRRALTAADKGAVVDTLQQILAPEEILRFARVALRAGCSSQQAYVLATWFSVQPTMNLDGVEVEDLCNGFEDPTDDAWREVLGKDFDFDSADAKYDEISGPETAPEPAA
jgi:DNA invertase Pin-like site-specific DNA recombinase